MNIGSRETVVPSRFPKGWIPPHQGEASQGWRTFFGYVFINLIAMPLLLTISLPFVPLEQQLLAYLLLCICMWPIVAHFSKQRPGLPVFPIICMVYATSYALPVYFGDPVINVMTGLINQVGRVRVSNADTTQAIYYCLMGVFAMQVGFWIFQYSFFKLFVPRLNLELDIQKGQRMMVFLGAVGILLAWTESTGSLSVNPRYLAVFVLFGRLSILSVAYLYVRLLNGQLDRFGKFALWTIVLASVMTGLVSGAVRIALDPLLTIGAVHWMVRRRISWKLAVFGLLFFFMMQSIKAQYRHLTYFRGTVHGSVLKRIQLMQSLASAGVTEMLAEDREDRTEALMKSMGRTDLIHLFGFTIWKTPRLIPYQFGRTYSYFIYTFIPRALWPNKPSAQWPNEYFGVTYRLQDPGTLGVTSVGLPHIVETYINFGAAGVVVLMMVLGFFYASLDRFFNHPDVGAGGTAIYATILYGLVNIETAASATFGALLQTIVIYVVMLRLVRAKKRLH
jgi:hypothetical protein